MNAGYFIKEARTRMGITQDELAMRTNINVRTIQRIESGEVKPRLHSLKTIATALDIDIDCLRGFERINAKTNFLVDNKAMLIFLHLSGILLIPSLFIWYFEKDRIKGVNEQGVDVINFQLTMLIIVLPCLILPPVALLVALYTTFIVLKNSYCIAVYDTYHYPLTIGFLKHGWLNAERPKAGGEV